MKMETDKYNHNDWAHAIYESSLFGIFVTDAEGNCIYNNSKYESITGYSLLENQGTGWLQTIHPDDKNYVIDNWRQPSKEKSCFEIDFRSLRKDYNLNYLNLKATKLTESGDYVCVVDNISERVQHEKGLILKNSYLYSILESSNAAIVSIDNEYKYVQFNSNYENVVKTRTGLKIKPGDNMLAPFEEGSAEHIRVKKNIDRALKGEEHSLTIEYNHKRINKFDIYEVSYKPIRDVSGAIIGASLYFVDLDERLQYEEKIREKGYLLKGVLDNVPVVVYKVNRQGEITYSVGSGLRPLGLQDHQMEGQNISQRQPETWKQMEEAFDGQTVMFVASSVFSARKYYFENHVFVDPYDKDLLICFALDVTLQKEAEKDLAKEKSNAEQAAAAKQHFLSNMSHEIRTPMNAVIGMTYLLMQENPKPEQMEYLNTLQFSSQNLVAIINDILDYSKIEAGKIIIEKVDFNLKNLLNGIKQSHLYKTEEKNINLKVKIDSELPEIVIGDEVRLGQVLNNLVDNAIKFTQEGNVIIDVSLKSQAEDNLYIDFSISDTGIGIPKDKVDYVFDSFTQASADTTRKFGGTGLGLAITKRLLELMDSSISLKTEHGQGSTFYFTLPLKKSTKVINNHALQQDYFESLNNIRVLLVEDNEINRFVVTKIMRKWDVISEYAVNGQDALDKIRDNDYDIVLMDIQMPIMDGYEATRKIRAMEGAKYQSIPIIALTASAMMDINDKVLAAGMDDHLSKPFNPTEMYKKIRKHVFKD